MPGTSLLEVDPDKLFELHSVNKIEDILQTVNNEIERRRVELRTLVGERYRDLIEAADKIDEMKLLSNKVISDIGVLNNSVSALGKTGVQPTVPVHHKKNKGGLVDVVTAQVKLLVDLPPLIWSHIEEQEFLNAVRLFLFARHIRTGFTVDKALKDASFVKPLVEQQWAVVNNFPSIILDAIQKISVLPNIEPCDCSKWLASAALLDPTVPALDRFLQYRKAAVALKPNLNPREPFESSYRALISTLNVVQVSFLDDWGGGHGGVWKVLADVSNEGPVVNRCDVGPLLSHLPPIVTHFRVHYSGRGSLTIEQIKEKVTAWLKSIGQCIKSDAGAVLRNTAQLSALADLHSITQEISAGDVGTQFGLENAWEELYSPTIETRAMQILTSEWDSIIGNLTSAMEQSFGNSDLKRNESDLRWYVWKESAADLSVNSYNSDTKGGLWLKSRAISPRVAELCRRLESKIAALTTDVVALNTHPALRRGHSSLASKAVVKLKEYTSQVVIKYPQEEIRLAALARFLQSIPDLCPSLRHALVCPHSTESSSVSADKPWEEAKALLTAESLSVWSAWKTAICQRLRLLIPSPTTSSVTRLLVSLPKWESVILEGEGDQKTELKVPFTASCQLQCLLQKFTVEITRASVPRMICEQTMEELVPHILSSYPDQFLCTVEGLQTLFDIRFVMAQYVSPTNKDLIATCEAKLRRVETSMDAVELELHSEHLHSSIKAALVRTQCLFGGKPGGKDTGSIKVSDDANIIAMSKSCDERLFFPPLPVASPASRPIPLRKTKASKTPAVSKSSEGSEVFSKASNVATSFFNEWFS